MGPRGVRDRTFGVLLLAAAVLFALTVRPLWVPVFLGIVIAVAATPLYARLRRRWPRHQGLLAAGVTAAVVLTALALMSVTGFILAKQFIALGNTGLDKWRTGGAPGLLGQRLTAFFAAHGVNPWSLQERVARYAGALAERGSQVVEALLGASLSGILGLIFVSLTAFYLLQEGDRAVEWIISLVPLPQRQTRELVREFRDVTRAILVSTLVTSAFQTLAGYIGFRLGGVPNPLVWAVLLGIASLLPGIGSALVWVPVGVATILTGPLWRGLVVFGWGALVIVGVADYVVRPRLVKAGLRLHELLVFIALFGGIEAFGPLGILLGPAFTALFLSLLRIYEREYRPRLDPATPPARPPEASESAGAH